MRPQRLFALGVSALAGNAFNILTDTVTVVMTVLKPSSFQ